MGLLIIAGGSLLLSQEHIKEKRKQRTWTRLRIRKSKGAYYSIIHDLSLTDKEDFRKYLRIIKLAAISILLFYLNKNWNYVSTCLFYTVQVDTAYQKTLYNSYLFLFLCHGIQETKEHVLHKWGFTVFCSKK